MDSFAAPSLRIIQPLSAQPTKFEMVINLNTANALALDMADKLLALADEVIQ